MTPIFDFHWVISALTTPTTTPSLVKTSLQKTAISRRHHWFPSEEIKSKNEKRVQKSILMTLHYPAETDRRTDSEHFTV